MKLERVHRALREHHAGIRPDAGFADRVVARLRYEPSAMLGWAAVRLLPAALALIVALGWISSRDLSVDPPADVVEFAETTDVDVIDWVLGDDGGSS